LKEAEEQYSTKSVSEVSVVHDVRFWSFAAGFYGDSHHLCANHVFIVDIISAKKIKLKKFANRIGNIVDVLS